MSGFRGLDTDPGWERREIRKLWRALRESAAAKRLPASTFPPGVIPSSALASPVASGLVSDSTSAFAVPTAGATPLTVTITVPPRMTACAVMLVGRAYAVNSTATADYLLSRVEVDTTLATAFPVAAQPTGVPGSGVLNVSALSVTLTGLTPGATFDVRLWARAQNANWSSSGSNGADLSGSLGWFTE